MLTFWIMNMILINRDTMKQKIILITGGTGYIGSHAVVAFEQAGYQTVTIDNLSNSSLDAFDGVEIILGYRPIFHHAVWSAWFSQTKAS